MRRLLLVLATAVVLTAALLAPGVPRALGDERAPRRVGVNRQGPWLTTSVSLRDLFQSQDGERLRSGFVHLVVIRVELWPEGGKQALYRADRTAELLYDLWEERFQLRITDRHGIQDTPALAASERPSTWPRPSSGSRWRSSRACGLTSCTGCASGPT